MTTLACAVAPLTADHPAFSVVICAYTEERWQDLGRAVRSVLAQRLPAQEIIVVIDHNQPMLERFETEFPAVRVIANAETRGLSGARNSGVAVAAAPIIAFLDDDAEADEGWLHGLAEAYRDEHVLGVGGEIIPDWDGGRPRSFPAEFHWVVGCSYEGLPRTPSPVRNLIGANMSIRRDVILEEGGFRTDVGRVGKRPLGCEETDLCIRARSRRPEGEFLYEPKARISHRVPRERSGIRYFLARCWAEGLSKAIVAQESGTRAGLSSERVYVIKTLPRGIARNLGDTLRGDPAGLARAAAIAVGVATTALGYAEGRRRAKRPSETRGGEHA